MTALAIVEAAPPPTFDTWLADGKALLQQRTEVEWQLADWLAKGRDQFGTQAQFDFLGDQLGIAPKRLKVAVKAATAFPPHLRCPTLTFEHHESVVNLPVPDALAVLRDAQANGWDDRETRVVAVRRRGEIEPTLPADHDPENDELMALARAWNRARQSVREEFLEMAQDADMGVIDA